MGNLNKKKDNSRLKSVLDSVLRVAEKKFSYEKKADSCRIRWGRLIIQAVGMYAELIKLSEIADLAQELDDLKVVVKQKWQ